MPDPSTAPKPFIFVLMPFAPEFDDIYKFGIKGAADDIGAYAERVDEQTFTDGILDRIFNQISKADVIVADMTGRNPNVFYEVGYAHALGKLVLLLTQHTDDIPFDLKHRQHIVYGGKIDALRVELAPRLQWAIGESKRRQEGVATDAFSLRLNNRALPPGTDPTAVQIGGVVKKHWFRLPLHLRNDSVEPLVGISHIYLFSRKTADLVPCDFEGETSSPATGPNDIVARTAARRFRARTRPEALSGFTANKADAPDGLTRQYRLPITFPAVPPGASEERHFHLMFVSKVTTSDEPFRLRVHTPRQFFDFAFTVAVEFEKPQAVLPAPAGAQSTTDGGTGT